MVPVINVLVHELGLRMVHAVMAHTIKVALDLDDRPCHDINPVFVTVPAILAGFGQVEASSKCSKLPTDGIDRLTSLLINRKASCLCKRLEVLVDSLLLAMAADPHHLMQGFPEPLSEECSEMATS